MEKKNVDIFDLINFTFVICTAAGLASNSDGFDTQNSLKGPRGKTKQGQARGSKIRITKISAYFLMKNSRTIDKLILLIYYIEL